MRSSIIFFIFSLSFNVIAGDPAKDTPMPYDNIEGDFIIEYPDGTPALKGSMKNGKFGLKKEGKWEYFYPTGILWSEEKWAYGRPYGVWVIYHPDGRIKKRDPINPPQAALRATPACMGPAIGYHSSACTGMIKSNAAKGN